MEMEKIKVEKTAAGPKAAVHLQKEIVRSELENVSSSAKRQSPIDHPFSRLFPAEQNFSKADQIREWVNAETAFDERFVDKSLALDFAFCCCRLYYVF